MPRASEANPKHQLVKALIVGDGKCGKTDWAARAACAGFNVLYLDADVGSQTIAQIQDRDALSRIFIMNVGDELISGGLDYRFVNVYKKFSTAITYRWNDTQAREFSVSKDGDPCMDEVWEIRPGQMDYTTILVIDSWTALSQSCMNWACDELGLSIEEISEDERSKMRGVYQAAGEKLTYYLQMIRSAKCHVIVIGHPREFTKTEKSAGKSVTQKESEMKVLWTKMVPASSSNNHAFSMSKYFTDIAWIEVDAMGEYKIDFRAANDRMSGSHINARLNTRTDGSFVELLKAIGGTVPSEPASFDHWLKIHPAGTYSYAAANPKKPALVLGAKKEPTTDSPNSKVGGFSLNRKVG